MINTAITRLLSFKLLEAVHATELEAKTLTIPYIQLTHYANFFASIAKEFNIEMRFDARLTKPIATNAELERKLSEVITITDYALSKQKEGLSGTIHGHFSSKEVTITMNFSQNGRIDGTLTIHNFKNATSNTLKDILITLSKEVASVFTMSYTGARFSGKVETPVEFKFK